MTSPLFLGRCAATTAKDLNTLELMRELREALCNRFSGRCPAAVGSRLHRRKLDPNRDVAEAAFGVQLAVEVYDEYHSYIAAERMALGSQRGLYIDIHGHGHTIQKAELGYLVTASELNSGLIIDPATTSICSLADYVGGDFDLLLRSGSSSFGGLMEAEGFAAVPSPTTAGPGNNSYFSGGYSTRVHGSNGGTGLVDAIQIESPSTFRELPTRERYVNALVNVIQNYLALNYPQQVCCN